MDAKKKNFLENLRLKTKFGNLKKPRKKPLDKQNRMLAHRRSISVPNLTLVPDEGFSIESGLESSLFFGISPRLSDSDSVASGSNADGPIFTEKPSDSVSETRLKVPTTHVDTAMNRMSAPVGSLVSEETEDPLVNSGLKGNLNLTQEGLYAQVDKKAKGNIPKFTFEPIPAPRSIFSNALAQSPKPDLPERGSPYGEDTPAERVLSDTVSAALIRASSLAEQMSPYTRKRTTSTDQKKPSSEKGTPPTTKKAPTDRTSLVLDTLGTPVESADGTSLDSACGTPSEERVNMPWTTDSEDLDRDLCSPLFMKEYCAEENLLEGAQLEEALEDITEMSSEQCDFFDENIIDPLENSIITTGPELLVPAPAQRYLLSINLKQGKNLIIRDKRSGTSDPYVKFKLEGKQLYKSKVVYKSLNPRWNESFSYPLRDREHIIDLRVYNKNRTADEFMGCSTICLKNLDLYKTYEMELRLSDPKKKDDDMGVILVDVCLMFRDATIKKGLKWVQRKNKVQQNQAAAPNQRPVEPLKNQQKNQMWDGVLSITLVEGQDLPQYGQGDIYVRFRLGDQKYKSKNLCIQANPQWREQFDFNQFEDNQEPLQVEVFSKRGRKGEESWGMFEIDLSRLPLNERQLYNHVLDPGKGRLVFLVTLRPCWGVSISDIENSTLEKPDERDTIEEKFSLKNSHKYMEEVGFLQVKVVKANDLPATDLNKKSNPLCVVELANSKLQTHTIYKTVNPEWSKVFTFPIKDIHDVIKLTVLDDNGDKAPNFLGKVAIPLLNVQNGQQISLLLKKEDLVGVSKGTITLVLEVIYNRVRAGIRTFKLKETKLVEENTKFSKKVLAQNIYRVRKISTAVLYTLQYINSCFQWESVQRSLIAFLIFLVTVWHWELFMLPLFLLLLLGWHYFQLSAGKTSTNQDLVNMSLGDDDEEDEKEAGKKGLMDKIHMVQEVVLVVQNVLEEIANIGERIKNMFNWSVPFLSCLACLVLFVATMLLYFIPLRYIVLIWGVNKFTKKLRNPYTIDNNEILNFLKRVPSDVQKSAEESCQGVVSGAGRLPFPDCEFFLGQEMKCHTGTFISQVQYSALRAPTSQNQPRRKK